MNDIASTLDAAILKPEMTESDVIAAMQSCLAFKPATFCVRPCDLPVARPVCRDHNIGLCVVLGFPHGCQLTRTKVAEARAYLEEEVDEIDMVSNIGWVKAGEWDKVLADISAVVAVASAADVPVKVIFETCFLNEAEVRKLVDVCVVAGATYVKTSTGFNGEGAQDEQVRWMVDQAAGRIKVKPSGGIRTTERANALLEMGADRLGVGFNSVPALCEGGGAEGDGY